MANANVATYTGRSIITNRLKGTLGAEPKNIGWGYANTTTIPNNGDTGSAITDVNLFQPTAGSTVASYSEARVAGASSLVTTTQLADTYQVTGTITCAGAAKTITEVALFDTTTASPTTTVATVTAGITSITLGSGTGFPLANSTVQYFAQLDNEVVLLTANSTATLFTVTRAQLGSTAVAHSAGAILTMAIDGGAGAGGATSGQIGPIFATTASQASYGGSMLGHADFAGVALNINDSIAFTIKDQFS